MIQAGPIFVLINNCSLNSTVLQINIDYYVCMCVRGYICLSAVVTVTSHSPQELESVNEDVQAMSTCCEEMTSRLKVW